MQAIEDVGISNICLRIYICMVYIFCVALVLIKAELQVFNDVATLG